MKKKAIIRFAAALSAAVLSITSAPVYAVGDVPMTSRTTAEEKLEAPDYTYEKNDTGITIKSYSGSDSVIAIPSEIDGYTVTAIGDFVFCEDSNITTAIIPNSVASVGVKSFYGCPNLVSVTIGSGLTDTGHYAFTACPKLSSIFIDSANQTLKYEKNFLVSAPGSILAYTGKDEELTIDGYTYIAPGAFAGNEHLVSLRVEDGMQRISYFAFAGCTALESVYLADSASNLASSCFLGCYSLKNVRLSRKTDVLAPELFSGCSSLRNIVLPESLEIINDDAFLGCTELSGIVLPKNLTIIGTDGLGRQPDPVTGKNADIEGFVIHGEPGSYAERYAEKVNATFKPFKIGDVNDDGIVDARDATSVLKYSTHVSSGKKPYFNSYQMSAANFNGDIIVDARDATSILVYATKLNATV